MANEKTDHPQENKVEVTIVVNGQSVNDTSPTHQKIKVAVEKALRDTGNKVDLSIYDITINGSAVDVDQSWEDVHAANNTTVIVSNRPGKKA